ncbi:MAG: DUF4178 domain-containing protein [Betaproteobacteria bacterium]|nr:DUF4178 domain-containing protein [Betaproteobacteria bacterium]
MKIGTCPSCAAPVKFRSAASVVAVCEYCTTTLVRNGEVLENIGRMAALQDDPTLIQIGTEGVYKSVHFAVIGRIQLRYENGLWNEWYLLFDDMRNGWLGEAAGEFYVTFEKQCEIATPAFSEIRIGDRINLGKVETEGEFEVSNFENATCIAGQGELPFKVGAGYTAPVVDLRRGTEFATIDYSDEVVRVYLGERVAVKTLKFANLRDDKAAYGIAEKMDLAAIKCPACAAPFKLSNSTILTYACPGCRSVLDTSSKTVQLVAKAQKALEVTLRLPLNSTGTIDGIKWEVIGHMRRGGSGFSWSEYLLFNSKEGFRWLVESGGHWSYVWNAEKPPAVQVNSVIYDAGTVNRIAEVYEHFQGYDAEVLHVLGEFYWRVRVGDTVAVIDYICPPRIISAEKTETELTWSVGRYMQPEEVQKAFALKVALPAPSDIAPNQPSPWGEKAGTAWKQFAILTVIALVVQLFFALRSQTVMRDAFSVWPGQDKEMTTKPFEVKGSNSNLVVRTTTNLDNAWMQLTYTLVDPATGKSWQSDREVAHYSGYEDGESWSEGDKSSDTVFQGVPAGKYVLNVSAELPKGTRRAVEGKFSVERGHASWINWLALQIALLFAPLFMSWRARSFEVRRWADSDHPKVSESSGSGDDDGS